MLLTRVSAVLRRLVKTAILSNAISRVDEIWSIFDVWLSNFVSLFRTKSSFACVDEDSDDSMSEEERIVDIALVGIVTDDCALVNEVVEAGEEGFTWVREDVAVFAMVKGVEI